MARRATRRRTAPRTRRRTTQDPIDAALALAAEKRWRQVSLADIAARAGVDEPTLRREYRSKNAIVDAFVRRIDDAVSAGTPTDADDEPTRDRLLDALLRRFDALTPHKTAIASIARDMAFMPPLALLAGTRIVRSMARTLEDAGVGARGPFGLMRAKALAAIYGASLCIWLNDDDAELARTTAFLDRRLNDAARLAQLCESFGQRRSRTA
jgi:AcrR family transcriptional regulator